MSYSNREQSYFQNNYEGLSYYVQTKEKVFRHIGYDCYFCGITFPLEELEAHHVNHDGHLDREKFKTAVSMYRYYAKHSEEARRKLAPICTLCHTEYHRG